MFHSASAPEVIVGVFSEAQLRQSRAEQRYIQNQLLDSGETMESASFLEVPPHTFSDHYLRLLWRKESCKENKSRTYIQVLCQGFWHGLIDGSNLAIE
jgi:hypothetical protein